MAEEICDCGAIDAHLAPYLDGEASPSMRESIAAHLAACPPCRRHADAESAAREIVRTRRSQLRGAAPDMLRARCASIHRGKTATISSTIVRRWVPLSLAATLLLAVSAAFLFSVSNPIEALAASLAFDHAKCFKVATLEADADHGAEAAELQQQQGWSLQIPKPVPAEGLQLVGVRRCLSTDGRAAHLMYTYHGIPLSLYVLPQDEGHAGTTNALGRDAVIWCASGRTYAVVADGHPPDLGRIVDYMKANVR